MRDRGASRVDANGTLTYSPVEGEPTCLKCGLMRRFGARPDDVLIDHIAGHPVTAKRGAA